jgi:hypothetical protein
VRSLRNGPGKEDEHEAPGTPRPEEKNQRPDQECEEDESRFPLGVRLKRERS